SPLAERRIVAGVVFFHHAHPLVAEMPRLRLYDNRAGPFRTMVGTGTPGTWQQRARPGEALLSGHTLRRRPTGGLSCLRFSRAIPVDYSACNRITFQEAGARLMRTVSLAMLMPSSRPGLMRSG